MRKIIAVLFVLASSSFLLAQPLPRPSPLPPLTMPEQGPTVVVAPAPAPAPAPTSLGTIAGDILEFVASIVAVPLSGALVVWLVQYARKFGVEITAANQRTLELIITNGLHMVAGNMQKTLDGKVPIQMKSQLVSQTVSFVQAHGVNALKGLGLDPTSQKAQDAIRSHIEKMILDPSVPVNVTTAPIQEAQAAGAPAMDLASVTPLIIGAIKGGADPLNAVLQIAPHLIPVFRSLATSMTQTKGGTVDDNLQHILKTMFA